MRFYIQAAQKEVFQFYLSSIKSFTKLGSDVVHRRFNSTLVQLKEFLFGLHWQKIPCFNSTLVQLKGGCFFNVLASLHSFNSTLVQLKGRYFKSRINGGNVSILP